MNELEFDSSRHAVIPFKSGQKQRSTDFVMFDCPANTQLIESSRKFSYSDLGDLQFRLIAPMNTAFGSNVFVFDWRGRGCKYVYVRCRA